MRLIDRTAETASTFMTLGGTRGPRHIFCNGNTRARRNTRVLSGIILHHTNFVNSSLDRYNHVIANYVVMRDGRVLKVREHAMCLNSVGTDHRAVDIEFEGVYGDGLITPPGPQLKVGRALVAYLGAKYGLTRIFGHRHFNPKPCPGPHIWYNVGLWAARNGFTSTGGTRTLPSAWEDPGLRVLHD